GTPTSSIQPAHNAEPLSDGNKLTEYGRKEIISQGNVIIKAFRKHEKQGNEIARSITENGLECESKPQWLGIIWLENELLSASSEVFSGGTRKAFRHSKESKEKEYPGVLASEFIKKPYGYVEGDIVPSYSVDTVLVREFYDVISVKKGQSDDEAAKKRITTLSLLCNKNLYVLKVYGGDVKIDHDCYRVAIEKRGTCLLDFMKSSHNHKKLKLLSGIVTGLLGLHDNFIFLGNLNISDIFVDKENSIAKISVISEKTKFPLISSSEGATDDMLADMRADMLALGRIIFFILAGVEYKNEDLTKEKPSNDNVKPIYGDPEALDLLRKLLHEVPAPTALQVWNHPLLWGPSKKLEFIWTVSEHLETEHPNSALSGAINKIGNIVFGVRWGTCLNVKLRYAVIKKAKMKYRAAEYSSMRYLIRFIRNLISHQTQIRKVIDGIKGKQNVPAEVLDMFATGNFGSYFFSRFPKLVMEVYNIMEEKCGEDIKFRVYFKDVLDN
nr:serine/threonine-protein kinase/endoribonuclease IRE1a-like [Tanacetum cinerariifolium]